MSCLLWKYGSIGAFRNPMVVSALFDNQFIIIFAHILRMFLIGLNKKSIFGDIAHFQTRAEGKRCTGELLPLFRFLLVPQKPPKQRKDDDGFAKVKSN